MKSSQQLKKQGKSSVCLFIEIVIALTIFMGLIVTLIYYFGAQEIHTDVPHALGQIFGSKKQKELITLLETKTYQYSNLWGANQTGIFQFLEHYADTRASKGSMVIVRRVQNNLYQTALKFIRYTKNYIQQNIDLQSDLQKSQWIFIVKNGQIPLDQLQRIKTKRPKDRIILGTIQKVPQLKKYKKVQYPGIKISDIQNVIIQDFGVSKKIASILTNYYQTVPQILYHLDQISYSHQKHLGEYYQNLKDLGKKQLKTIKNLCQKGSATLDGNKNALEQVGIVTYNNIVYWDQRIRKLNYQLSQEIQCVDKIVPSQIKQKILKQRQQRQQAQAQEDKQQEQKQQQQTKSTTSTSTAKKSTKSASKTEQKPADKKAKKAQKEEKVQKVQKVQKKAGKTTEKSTKAQKSKTKTTTKAK